MLFDLKNCLGKKERNRKTLKLSGNTLNGVSTMPIAKEESEELPSSQMDFERDRHTLLDLYHSDIQNHVGYLLAITIGSLTLMSRWDVFFSSPQRPVSPWVGLLFDVMLSVILALSSYVVARMIRWTKFANYALSAQKEAADAHFAAWCVKQKEREEKKGLKFNLSYYEKAPYTLKLENAAFQYYTYDIRVFSFDSRKVFLFVFVPSIILLLALFFSNVSAFIF